MKIQTLSIAVPTKRCVNNCPFCVSKLHTSPYVNQIENNIRFQDLYENDYMKRLQFARDNGCNTAIFTGDGEPLQNKNFLKLFANWNQRISSPFQWMELQSTGVFITDETLRFLRNTVGITTISLSVSDLFGSANNGDIIGIPPASRFNIEELCAEIKRYDFNLRLSLNLIDTFNQRRAIDVFERAKHLKADQIIFRKMYTNNGNSEVDKWITAHKADDITEYNINEFIKFYGKPLERLPFGAVRYSVMGMSTVFDGDCMATDIKEELKYLILQPNSKLYSKWDDPASLIF